MELQSDPSADQLAKPRLKKNKPYERDNELSSELREV